LIWIKEKKKKFKQKFKPKKIKKKFKQKFKQKFKKKIFKKKIKKNIFFLDFTIIATLDGAPPGGDQKLHSMFDTINIMWTPEWLSKVKISPILAFWV